MSPLHEVYMVLTFHINLRALLKYLAKYFCYRKTGIADIASVMSYTTICSQTHLLQL